MHGKGARRVGAGPRPALWIVAGLVLLVPPAVWSLGQVELRNDLGSWLSPDDPQAQLAEWSRGEFPAGESILVSWDGSSLADPRTPAFAALLRGTRDAHGIPRNNVKYVETVVTPHEVLARMEGLGVDRPEAIRRLTGMMVGGGPVCVTLTADGRRELDDTVRRITAALKSRMGILARVSTSEERQTTAESNATSIEPGSAVELAKSAATHAEVVPSTASDEEVASVSNVAPVSPSVFAIQSREFEIEWPGMHQDADSVEKGMAIIRSLKGRSSDRKGRGAPLVETCFRQPGTPIAIAVTLSEAGSAEPAAAVAALRETAARAGIPAESLRMAGGGVAAAALSESAQKLAWNPSAAWSQPARRSTLLASALASLALMVFATRRLQVTAGALVVSILATLTALAVVPAISDGVTLFALLLPTILLGLSLSVSMAHANLSGPVTLSPSERSGAKRTIAVALPGLMTGGIVVVSVASLAVSPLSPVRDFALSGAAACAVALIVVACGLLALLSLARVAGRSDARIPGKGWTMLAGWADRNRGPIVIGASALAVVSMLGLRSIRTETRIVRYVPHSSPVVEDYRILEERLTGVVPVDVLVRFDADAMNRTSFVQRLEAVRDASENLRALPEVRGVLSLADFQPVAAPPADEAPFVTKAKFSKRSRILESRALGAGAESGASSFVSLARAPMMSGDGLFTARRGDELWRIAANVNMAGDQKEAAVVRAIEAAAQKTLRYHAGAAHAVTGTLPLVVRTQRAMIETLVDGCGISFALLALGMMIAVRSPIAGVMAMVPGLLATGFVFGLVSWFRMPIDLGAMLTATLAMGIGAAGTAVLATSYRAALRRGLTRDDAIAEGISRCGPTLIRSALITGVGLLILSSSELLLVSRFGGMMAALVTATLLANLAVTPALLSGRMGEILQEIEASRQAAVDENSHDTFDNDAMADLAAPGQSGRVRSRHSAHYANVAKRRPRPMVWK